MKKNADTISEKAEQSEQAGGGMIAATPNPAPTPSFSLDKRPDYEEEDKYPAEKLNKQSDDAN